MVGLESVPPFGGDFVNMLLSALDGANSWRKSNPIILGVWPLSGYLCSRGSPLAVGLECVLFRPPTLGIDRCFVFCCLRAVCVYRFFI